MTEPARAALTEAKIRAEQEKHLRRIADGDVDAILDFFLVRGIDLRSAAWEVIAD